MHRPSALIPIAMQFNHIANAAVPSSSGRTIPVIDPSDGQPFDEIQRSNADDIDAAVHAARQCYNAVWQRMAPADRGRLLQPRAKVHASRHRGGARFPVSAGFIRGHGRECAGGAPQMASHARAL